MTAWVALQTVDRGAKHGTKAEGRHASPGRPRARRCGCPKRTASIFRGLGWYKAQQIKTRIAAPRPDAARLGIRDCDILKVPLNCAETRTIAMVPSAGASYAQSAGSSLSAIEEVL